MAEKNYTDQIHKLIREEELDDFEKLLKIREWDEVPLFSRCNNISFLSHLTPAEQSRVLVTAAVTHLSDIIRFINTRKRSNLLVLVSRTNWNEMHAVPPEVVQPHFRICTNVKRDLAKFTLTPGKSKEAVLTASWLKSANLLNDYTVFEQPGVESNSDLYRIYVACKHSQDLHLFIQPHLRS